MTAQNNLVYHADSDRSGIVCDDLGGEDLEHALMVGPYLAGDPEAHLAAEDAGYRVLTAADGSEGLELSRRHRPTLVVLDHAEESGADVALMARLRTENPACEVIAVVGEEGSIDLALRVLGAGALDYLHRPLQADQLREALQRARARTEARREAMRPAVLVLEDDDFTRDRLTRILEREGYRVGAAADGAAGIRAFEKSQYDIILCDLNMPGKNGIEVLREAKANDPDVEVILVTGQADERLVVDAMRGGASNFLCKPIDLDDLFEALERALGAQAARRSQRGRRHELEALQELLVQITPALPVIVHAPEGSAEGPLAQLRDLVDEMPVAILLVDARGHVLYGNRSAQRSGAASPKLSPAWQEAIGARHDEVQTVAVAPGTDLVVAPLRVLSGGADSECYAVVVREGPDLAEAR